MIFSDKALSQKIERAEARSNADLVETRARLQPESGATGSRSAESTQCSTRSARHVRKPSGFSYAVGESLYKLSSQPEAI